MQTMQVAFNSPCNGFGWGGDLIFAILWCIFWTKNLHVPDVSFDANYCHLILWFYFHRFRNFIFVKKICAEVGLIYKYNLDEFAENTLLVSSWNQLKKWYDKTIELQYLEHWFLKYHIDMSKWFGFPKHFKILKKFTLSISNTRISQSFLSVPLSLRERVWLYIRNDICRLLGAFYMNMFKSLQEQYSTPGEKLKLIRGICVTSSKYPMML